MIVKCLKRYLIFHFIICFISLVKYSSATTINETASKVMTNAGISITNPTMNITRLISIFLLYSFIFGIITSCSYGCLSEISNLEYLLFLSFRTMSFISSFSAFRNSSAISVAYIKKASHSALEKIRGEYERRQLEETNEYLTETLMGKLSEFMEGVNMIDDAKSMEEELVHSKMVKRDLKNILGYVTPYIPLIGLVCGISIVGKHMYNRKPEQSAEE